MFEGGQKAIGNYTDFTNSRLFQKSQFWATEGTYFVTLGLNLPSNKTSIENKLPLSPPPPPSPVKGEGNKVESPSPVKGEGN